MSKRKGLMMDSKPREKKVSVFVDPKPLNHVSNTTQTIRLKDGSYHRISGCSFESPADEKMSRSILPEREKNWNAVRAIRAKIEGRAIEIFIEVD